MINSKISFILFFVLFSVISGCRTKKGENAIDLDSQVMERFWNNQFDYNYLEMRGKASIIRDGKTNNVSMHFKMKKDSILWGRFSLFGFEIGRVKITKDSFFLVNSMQSEYMLYDNQYLEEFIGFRAEVGQIQSLLLGNAPFDSSMYALNKEEMKLEANEGIATNTLELNSDFRTLLSNILTPDTTQKADIQYDTYENLNNKLMPKNVNISVKNSRQALDVVLNYQVVNSNTITTFPFSIPNGYKRR
ncbi:MAG: DUF4292 domain-containing protein [Bacteroidia bacterium]|nr:DUF4292 domain-containing protein [Bacteroidia bacterium]